MAKKPIVNKFRQDCRFVCFNIVMNEWKIVKGLLVTFALLFLTLCMLISKGFYFILEVRDVLNESIIVWFDGENDNFGY